MTLVVSCLTHETVVLVSDRRLTWLTGPQVGTVMDDEQNKSVVICNRMTFAYTGLAETGAEKTDEWLLDIVASVVPYNPRRILDSLATAATEAFRRISLTPHQKRHAFIAAGWARFAHGQPLRPFEAVVSNYHDEDGNALSAARETFAIRLAPLTTQSAARLTSVGQPIPVATNLWLRRQVIACVRHEVTPLPVVRLIAGTIRSIAQLNDRVGSSLMATVLPAPKPSDSGGLLVPLAWPIDFREATALYIPRAPAGIRIYAPHHTCNGTTIKNAYVEPGARFPPADPDAWHGDILILCRRTGEYGIGNGIEPQFDRAMTINGWGLFAEYRRSMSELATPCIVRTTAASTVPSICDADRPSMLIMGNALAPDGWPGAAWIEVLVDWLRNAGVGGDELDVLVPDIVGRTHKTIAETLRIFFRGTELGKPDPEANR